jgi:8-oxo-dGTP diphosphatase
MAHIHYDIDWTVGAFIVEDGKVLFIHHRKLDIWICPGGHVELNEDPVEALYREVKEEVGLEITVLASRPGFEDRNSKPLLQPTWMDIHQINRDHRHIGLFYVAVPKRDPNLGLIPALNLAVEEAIAYRWLAAHEMPGVPMWPATRWYAQQAILMVGKNDSGAVADKP